MADPVEEKTDEPKGARRLRTTTSVGRDVLSDAVIRGSYGLKLQKKLPMMLEDSGLTPWSQGSLSKLKSGYNYASFVFRRSRVRNLVEAN